MTEVVATNETILVVGGGISGMTAALEAAETGKQVVLVEKRPYLGGRVSQLYKYFPKLCHPTCGLEINQRRTKMNPNLTVLTMAEVTHIRGDAGDYTATVKLAPRYVNDRCTACGDCVEVCPKDLFSLQPMSHRLWVACKNQEQGDEAEAECAVLCTAWRAIRRYRRLPTE